MLIENLFQKMDFYPQMAVNSSECSIVKRKLTANGVKLVVRQNLLAFQYNQRRY